MAEKEKEARHLQHLETIAKVCLRPQGQGRMGMPMGAELGEVECPPPQNLGFPGRTPPPPR